MGERQPKQSEIEIQIGRHDKVNKKGGQMK